MVDQINDKIVMADQQEILLKLYSVLGDHVGLSEISNRKSSGASYPQRFCDLHTAHVADPSKKVHFYFSKKKLTNSSVI